VVLLRASPGAGEPQKDALRSLMALTDEKSATVRCYDGALAVDDLPVSLDTPDVASLVKCLRAHAVAEIMVARSAEPAELLALVRGLSSDAGRGRIKERLRDAASTRVMVVLERPYELAGAPRSRSVTQAFLKEALDGAVLDEWNKFLSTGARADVHHAVPLGVDPPEDAAPPPADAAATAASVEPAPPPPPSPPRAGVSDPMVTSAPPGVPAPGRAAPPQPATVQAFSPLGKALANVLQDPYGPDLLARMTQFARCAQDAFGQNQVAEAIDALAIVIDLESKAPPGSPRAGYAVIIQRVLNGAALTKIAPFVLEQKRAARATVVVRRGGDDAVELLLGLLVTAESLRERRAYVGVLRGMPQGVDRVLQILSNDQWQLVRNIAEVIGEEGLERGVSYLARLLEHRDGRVQRAAAVALAKIGSPATVEPVRRLLTESAAELKALIVQSVGTGAQALAPLLVALASAEANPDLLREYFRALGRIGSPDALRGLEKAAQAGGRMLGRKPTAVRLAAIEGLRLATGPVAERMLETFVSDGDKAIRAAAQDALGAVRAKSAVTT
jgi:HEAT repeat protein